MSAYPTSHDDEAGIIACCIEFGKDTAIEAIENLPVEALSRTDTREVFGIIEALTTQNCEVNCLTVGRKYMELYPGRQLPDVVSQQAHSPEMLPSHIEAVTESWKKRTLMEACQTVLSKGQRPDTPHDHLISMIETALSGTEIKTPKTFNSRECCDRLLNDLERRFLLQGKLSGISTGLPDLDAITDGLQSGEQAIIGARPSMGKTALGVGIAMNASFVLKIPTLFVSLEMSIEALMRRLCSAWCKIPMNTLRRGSYSEKDFHSFTHFRDFAAKSPLFITDAIAGIGINQLAATIRRRVRKDGVKLVIVDYLQKVKPSERQEKKTYEIGEVSSTLKAIAVSTNCAMLTLAQLNRESDKEGKKGRPPRLTDLGDSKQIEQDGDLVALIHRDRSRNQQDTSLIIAKQRDGETGIVNLFFNGQYAKFESVSKVFPDDVPEYNAPHPND